MSSCVCINAGRVMSITIRRSLKITSLTQVTDNVRVEAQHSRTEVNTVAFLLSRGHFQQIRDYMEDYVQPLHDENLIPELDSYFCKGKQV